MLTPFTGNRPEMLPVAEHDLRIGRDPRGWTELHIPLPLSELYRALGWKTWVPEVVGMEAHMEPNYAHSPHHWGFVHKSLLTNYRQILNNARIAWGQNVAGFNYTRLGVLYLIVKMDPETDVTLLLKSGIPLVGPDGMRIAYPNGNCALVPVEQIQGPPTTSRLAEVLEPALFELLSAGHIR